MFRGVGCRQALLLQEGQNKRQNSWGRWAKVGGFSVPRDIHESPQEPPGLPALCVRSGGREGKVRAGLWAWNMLEKVRLHHNPHF